MPVNIFAPPKFTPGKIKPFYNFSAQFTTEDGSSKSSDDVLPLVGKSLSKSSYFDEPENTLAALQRKFPSIFARPNSPLARWLSNQTNRLHQQYISKEPDITNLHFLDMLSGYNPQVEFGALAPSLRGERPSIFAPRVRFIG